MLQRRNFASSFFPYLQFFPALSPPHFSGHSSTKKRLIIFVFAENLCEFSATPPHNSSSTSSLRRQSLKLISNFDKDPLIHNPDNPEKDRDPKRIHPLKRCRLDDFDIEKHRFFRVKSRQLCEVMIA